MKVGYARVSTKDQSFDLQVDTLRKAGSEKFHREVVSGARAEQPIWDQLIDNLRSDDVLII